MGFELGGNGVNPFKEEAEKVGKHKTRRMRIFAGNMSMIDLAGALAIASWVGLFLAQTLGPTQ